MNAENEKKACKRVLVGFSNITFTHLFVNVYVHIYICRQLTSSPSAPPSTPTFMSPLAALSHHLTIFLGCEIGGFDMNFKS